MHSRGTPLFVILIVLLAAFGYLLRSWSFENWVRDHDDALLQQNATAIGGVVHRTVWDGTKVMLLNRFVRITLTAESAVAVRKESAAPLERARTIAMALGGRLEGEYADGLEAVRPRR